MYNEPILITGCARSGTSLTAGIFDICGAYGGNICGATPYNKKGQFENTEIRNRIVKKYLKSHNLDPLCQDILPSRHLDSEPEWKDKILNVIIKNGYDGKQRWYYKGAKMCLMWQLWHYAFPNAIWIIVRRNAKDIANSCLRTPFMRKRTTFESWMEWVKIHEQRFQDMEESNLFICNVYPSELINGLLDNIKRIVQFLNLTWDEGKVKKFIEPQLWKGLT